MSDLKKLKAWMAEKPSIKHDVLGPLSALTFDACREFPDWHHVLGTFMDTLFHELSTFDETINFLMIDLPSVGKLYDKGLSSGTFDYSLLTSKLNLRSSLADSLMSLLRYTFDEAGRSLQPEVNVVFYTRCLLYLYKKVEMECTDEATNIAFDDFVDIERELRIPSSNWGEVDFSAVPGLRFADLDEGPEVLRDLDKVAGILGNFIPFDYRDIVPKHGPGSVSDLKRSEDKYTFPSWSAKLQAVFPKSYFTTPWGDLQDLGDGEPITDRFLNSSDRLCPTCSFAVCRCNDPEPTSQEPLGRLIGVPKTLKGPRLITVEPASHQFLQQGLMDWIRCNMHRILRNSIDFSDQQPSRDVALQASLDGSIATVDLSSASDRLSCWTVERAIRNTELLKALNAVRTMDIVLMRPGASRESAERLSLKKFAGMGSAVTFPVQSIVYAMCAYTAVLRQRGLRINMRTLSSVSREVRVFGDDIAIPSEAVPVLVQILHALQLRVNTEKTHDTGCFRESCGMDAYRGVDVTPFYLSSLDIGRNPAILSSWVEVCNNAFLKGLWCTASYLQSWIECITPFLAVAHVDERLGGLNLVTYSRSLPKAYDRGAHSLCRFDIDTQSRQYRVLIPVTVSSTGTRGTATDLLQYFLEKPSQDPLGDPKVEQWQPGWLVRARTKFKFAWV